MGMAPAVVRLEYPCAPLPHSHQGKCNHRWRWARRSQSRVAARLQRRQRPRMSLRTTMPTTMVGTPPVMVRRSSMIGAHVRPLKVFLARTVWDRRCAGTGIHQLARARRWYRHTFLWRALVGVASVRGGLSFKALLM